MFFLELSCFFDDPANVGHSISGSSAFSKTSLNIWKFTVHILLKSHMENVEHYFASTWDEYNCVVVWAFFGIAFLWDWKGNGPFPVLWPLQFSKFAHILSAALSQHHLLGFEIAQLKFHEFEYTPGVGDGQGGLVCCSPWGPIESDRSERLTWTHNTPAKSTMSTKHTSNLATY